MRMRTIAGLVAGALAAVGVLVPSATAGADSHWAPAATAAIHPGVQTITEGGQCTANFVYTDGADVYIGQAAHCASLGGPTDLDGCTTPTQPVGTPVEIQGAEHPGTLAYSSWAAMQASPEQEDADTCSHNDFALVRIDPRDVAKVNPSVPHWGGPVGLNSTGIPAGQRVFAYGNSSLRLGLTVLSPKTGLSFGTEADGWNHPVINILLDVPGDSGSGLMDASGRAAGVLSSVSVGVPTLVRNNYSDVANALEYMRTHGGPQASLVNGTEPFNPNRLPLGV